MKRKNIYIIFLLFLLLIPTALINIPIPSVPARGPEPIGYEINGDVVEIWNPDTSYYFNKTSGIQWTEDPNAFWTRNVFAIGYYSGGEWHKIFSADELGTFERSIESDFSTYVNATLWKDFNYAGYDLRLGVRYHLKLDDTDLSVIIYAKNLDTEDYPFPLGFAWIVTDIDIPNPKETDTIFINETDYVLDGVFDETFTNMNRSWYRIFDFTQFITLEWDNNLNYAVRLQCNGILEDAKISLLINAGVFNPGQEKSTIIYWADAEGSYTGVHWDISVKSTDVIGITNNGTHHFIVDADDEEVYIYTLAGVFAAQWDTNAQTTSIGGITMNSTHVFIVDFNDEEVYIYTKEGAYQDSFDISAKSLASRGIATDNTNIWVLDFSDEEVYRYTMAGVFVDQWNTDGQTSIPLGIGTDGNYIWVTDITDDEVYRYTMAGVSDGNWDTSGESGDPAGITMNEQFFWICDSGDEEVYQYSYVEPSLISATILDMDDGDNLYEMLQYYTFQGLVNDSDGAVDIANVSMRGIDGTTIMFEVRAYDLDGVPKYNIISNSTEIQLDSANCDWIETGDQGNVTFKIKFNWNFTDTANMELNMTAVDTTGSTLGWTEMQADYFDIIGRLVVSDLATNSTGAVVGSGIQITGVLNYSTAVGGDVASSSNPPDSEITDVAVHDESHVEVGVDTTVVDGSFSVNFTAPETVDDFIYHIYIDGAPDYVDADAPDGDTITISTYSGVIAYSFDDETGSIAVDLSGLDNHGTISGATRENAGLYGRALNFDGADDYIVAYNASSLNITGSLTICAWIYTADTGAQGILNKTGAYSLSIIPNYGIKFTINSTSIETAAGVFSANTWTFVAGVYNGSHQLIYVGQTLSKSGALTGAVNINANNVFVGNSSDYFNGTMDEVRLLNYTRTATQLVSFMWDPIADFPYCLDASIATLESGDWVFAEEEYTYTGRYVRQNASDVFDSFGLLFNDGIYYANMTFDSVEYDFDISSDIIYESGYTNSSSGNVWTINWDIYILIGISDAGDVDLQGFCNFTTGAYDGWEVVEEDYFSIFTIGTVVTYEYNGDGANVASGNLATTGGGEWGIGATNGTLNSWAQVNKTKRNLYHSRAYLHLYVNDTYDVPNGRWNCLSEDTETGYWGFLWYYYYNGQWIEGPRVEIRIQDGMVGPRGMATGSAWIQLNVTTYNSGEWVQKDYPFAFAEAYQSTDTTTQIGVVVDIWISDVNTSSVIKTRVSAENYAMNKSGWGPFTDWQPYIGQKHSCETMMPFLSDTNTIIAAPAVDLYKFSIIVNKTGAGGQCDGHQFTITDIVDVKLKTTPATETHYGIQDPMFVQIGIPGIISPGWLTIALDGIVEGIMVPLLRALRGVAEAPYFVVKASMDAAGEIMGVENFVDNAVAYTTIVGANFGASVTNFGSLITLAWWTVTTFFGTFIKWSTSMFAFFGVLFGHINDIAAGTSVAATGIGNIWDFISFNIWGTGYFIPIILFIYFMLDIDNTARRQGGGWITIAYGRIQMWRDVFSYFLGIFSTLISAAIQGVFGLAGLVGRML